MKGWVGFPNETLDQQNLESVQDTLKEIIRNLREKCLDIILSSEDRGSLYYQPKPCIFNGKSLQITIALFDCSLNLGNLMIPGRFK